MAYGLDDAVKTNDKKTILVFDLGGGTFDVSVLRVYGGDFKVLATDGDTHLGGEDFDDKLVEHFASEFERKKKVNVRGNKRAMKRLKTACERIKRQLSAATEAHVEVDGLHQGKDLFEKLTRAKFESLCDDYFRKCITIVDNSLKEAGVSKFEVMSA